MILHHKIFDSCYNHAQGHSTTRYQTVVIIMLKDTTLQDSELLLLNDTLANICYYMLKDTKIKSVIWQQFLRFLIFTNATKMRKFHNCHQIVLFK